MSFDKPEYYTNPNINLSIEDIWRDIDSATDEILVSDTVEKQRKNSSMQVLLPPLKNKNKFVKGLLISRGVDYLYSIFPNIGNSFITIANSMWGSYPASIKADAYLTLYKNPAREEWFKKTNPDKADKILIPYQDADISNELVFFPVNVERDIDIIAFSRFSLCKNLDLFLKSLIYVDKKYNKKLNTYLIVGDKERKYKQSDIYKNLISIAGNEDKLFSYIHFIDYESIRNLFFLYSRAKLTAFTSIFEGKNRCIQESLLCNTPVVLFKHYNQYIKGESSVLPEGCFYEVDEFSYEAFGDKIYHLLDDNKINYKTREIALKHYGRINTINKILDIIPYFRDNIPDFEKGDLLNNDFINSSLTKYETGSYFDFLYKNPSLTDYVSDANNILLYKYCSL